MNKTSMREVKLSTVFIAVLVLGISAGFSSSNAAQDMEVSEIIKEEK
ncbi:hypothetical protein RI845_06085 [Thalassotalea nanhaiensis]|uniref:Uncharacterized protein n=1 Tax=Thalassotalea nanhaiensis TaxID=3065648 RepID=A0ABY9TLK3_9GAMM|nr:hypothetical protein RI845_06085 [Colwelliaceae bacterium SQ345]